MVEANWSRKTEILKALTEPESNMREIASRFNVSRGTIYNTLNEFTNIFRLTEEESDFPRKLLKYYTVELPEGVEPIDKSDIRALRHFVERAKKKEMDESDMDAIPGDFTNNSNDNNYRAQSIGMSSTPGGERFDTTTEEGLLRSILYKAKNVNPGAIERFIEAFDLGRKHFTANPQALQQLMMHTFGPGFGSDAFQLFMNTRGQYVADNGGGAASYGNGSNNIMQMLMMQAMMQGGGQNMAQMLPLIMQMSQNGNGSGGGGMGDMMGMMMMSQMNKQAEKQAQQEKFDQMMNMMMLRMIGGTMDSRSQMDASGGNFMVQEVLDKDKNVKERHLVPMATVMSNPLMMGGLFRPQQDETTQMVLKNALDEKSKAWEMIATANQPLNQILMTLLGNFQSKNDPVAQFAQLMDIRDKYMGGGMQVDPEIEKMKIDLQLATNQQNMQLEQMKHQWDMEREEKKAGSENVKSWMGMIGQVGEKLATPAMALIAGGMGGGKAGLLNAGAPAGPGGLPPLGSGPQPVKPGDISRPVSQPSPESSMFGVPDPDHNQHLLPPDPIMHQQQEQGGMDPQLMMMLAKQQQNEKALQDAMAEIHRLRSVIVQEQHTAKHQQVPVVDKKQLANMSESKLKEILESLKDNESNTEQMRMALEAELSDREWLSSNAMPDVDDIQSQPRQVPEEPEEEPEPVDPNIIEATQQETIEELPDEPPTQEEIDQAVETESEPVQDQLPEPEKKTRRKKQ